MRTDLFLSFCRGQNHSIAGSWFQRRDIHPLSWTSNDGITRKEIDHVSSSCGKLVCQCRVQCCFDIDLDHFPVKTSTLKLKRSAPASNKCFVLNLTSDDAMIQKICCSSLSASESLTSPAAASQSLSIRSQICRRPLDEVQECS